MTKVFLFLFRTNISGQTLQLYSSQNPWFVTHRHNGRDRTDEKTSQCSDKEIHKGRKNANDCGG